MREDTGGAPAEDLPVPSAAITNPAVFPPPGQPILSNEAAQGASATAAPTQRRHRLRFLAAGLAGAALLSLLLLISCRTGPPTTERTLSSGETVRVISVTKMYFRASGPALVLRYQTDLDLDDREALAAEVAGIWPDFQRDVASAEVTAAAITASEMPSGWPIYHARTYTFIYTEQPDGTWRQEPAN